MARGGEAGHVGADLGQDDVRSGEADAGNLIQPGLCVPKTSSMSCDQVILVDQATDASAFSDAVVVEIGRLG